MTAIVNDLRNIATAIITNRVDGYSLRPLNPIGFSDGCYPAIFVVIFVLLPTLVPDSVSAQTNSADLAELLQRTARTVSPAIIAIGHVDNTTSSPENTSAKQQHIRTWTIGVAISEDTLICAAHLLPLGNNCQYVLSKTTPTNATEGKQAANQPQLHLIAIEYDYDIAVFKINGGKYPFIPIAPAEKLATADIVVGFGNRSNTFAQTNLDIRLGIVSASERYLLHKGHLTPWLVTDAAIDLGSRGTVIVNLKGQLVGLAGHTLPQQALVGKMGYARSCEKVFRGVLSQLRKGAPVQPGALGLNVRMTDEGLQVTKVTPTGSAKTAGIEIGDVLNRFAGVKLTDAATLQRRLFGLHAGDSVMVQWTHSGEPVEKQITLGTRVYPWEQADFFLNEPSTKN
jgi:S1-C subfamily serine protease